MSKYILKGKKAVPVKDVLAWAEWFEGADRRVAKTTLKDGTVVSTVFLGIDHGYGEKPLLFETMVFGSEDDFRDLDMERYQTWEEAEKGHKRMVSKYEKNDK